MTRHRARSFQLESLEGKQLLSTLHPAHHATSKPAPLVLDGTLKGLESQIAVSGLSGEIKSLGRVHADDLSNTGFGDGTNAETKIVIEGAKGSVTLSYGPDFVVQQMRQNSETLRYHYAVVSGTGAYTGASGTGIIDSTNQSNDGWTISPNLKTIIRLHTTRST